MTGSISTCWSVGRGSIAKYLCWTIARPCGAVGWNRIPVTNELHSFVRKVSGITLVPGEFGWLSTGSDSAHTKNKLI